MMGLAGEITPTTTGSVLIFARGTITAASGTAAGDGLAIQLSYGTGAAPSNGDSETGTQLDQQVSYTNPAAVTAADVHVPFTLVGLATGLAIGTSYWVDLAAKGVATSSDFAMQGVVLIAVEVGGASA